MNYLNRSDMSDVKLLELGRVAFKKEKWDDAFSHLTKADAHQYLQPQDLETLAVSAYLTGNFNICYDTLTRCHNAFLKNGDIPGAVRCAFWLGFILVNRGESARGSGWLGHAKKILNEGGEKCVEEGYLQLPVALKCLSAGDSEGSQRAFEKALEIGNQFHDRNLTTLAHLGIGQSLIRKQELDQGVSLLDEAMVAVESGGLSPIVKGIVYCAVIETCMDIFDLGRAQEWTEVLSDWCSTHPYLVPFRGQCLTRRSEIMLLHGEWNNAIHEAIHAIDLLSKPTAEPAVGAAFYQLGELYRLQGAYQKAEKAYNEANKFGRNPQPGLALMRLVQGQTEKAKSSITHALQGLKNIKTRSDMLFACIEIMLVDEDIEGAKSWLSELNSIAQSQEAPFLNALTKQAEGAILLAEGKPDEALHKLRKAQKIWEELKAPYENARTRMLIASACRNTGDEDTAKMEFEAAQWTFQQLNAIPDLVDTDTFFQTQKPSNTSDLSKRERQVLQLIAVGNSNKTIANELFISERTVERHVSNIFTKLSVSSRSAATAFAFKHQLI